MPQIKMMNPVRKIIKNIFLFDACKQQEDVEKARKLMLVNGIALMCIVLLIIVGTISYSQGSKTAGIFDLAVAASLVACNIILRRTGEYRGLSRLGVGSMTALFLYLFISGGPGKTGFLWYYTYPPAVLYIMGRRDGSIFNAVLLAPSLIYMMLMWNDASPLYFFEPFFTTKKMGRSGTGLGMAVVWGTVQDHNGHIDVKSHPQKGTAFDLYFPALSGHKTPKSINTAAALSQGNNEKIVVVDDVAEQREIAAGILENFGYSVHAVSGGEAAFDYLQDAHADLVILDMTMEPGIDGLETFQRILKFNPRQQVIIATGYSESEKVRQAQDLGAVSYLKKPYSVESIAGAVQKALEK